MPGQPTDLSRPSIIIGRYLLHRQIARGGMATIHIARLIGDEGFSRIVAAKRLHPEFAEDPEFVSMFLDEARIASKVHHPNVVPVLDVVTTGEEVVLVQEYVHGAPLHWLLRTAHEAKTHVPINVAVSIAVSGARRPARRARDGRRDGQAARHRASRRVAAERHGGDRRHRAPARLRRSRRRRWPRTSRARACSRASSRTWRPSRSAARRRGRATSTRCVSCCGSCSSGIACTASRRARPSSSARSCPAGCRRSPKRSRPERDVARREPVEAARDARADHPAGPRDRFHGRWRDRRRRWKPRSRTAVPPASPTGVAGVAQGARQGVPRRSRQGDRGRGGELAAATSTSAARRRCPGDPAIADTHAPARTPSAAARSAAPAAGRCRSRGRTHAGSCIAVDVGGFGRAVAR